MKLLNNIYLAYFAYFYEVLNKRGINLELAHTVSIILVTLILLLQLHIIVLTALKFTSIDLNYVLYLILIFVIIVLNFIYLNNFRVQFTAKLGFTEFDDEDKLMMTIWLRLLLIVDIFVLLIFL